MFPLTTLHQLHTSLLIVASSRQSTLMAPISESDSHVTLQPLQSRDVATFCISITFSPCFIFFIILLFQLWFLVYRHTSNLSRALSFSFRIPLLGVFSCCIYVYIYIYLGSPARSRLSRSAVALTSPPPLKAVTSRHWMERNGAEVNCTNVTSSTRVLGQLRTT